MERCDWYDKGCQMKVEEIDKVRIKCCIGGRERILRIAKMSEEKPRKLIEQKGEGGDR